MKISDIDNIISESVLDWKKSTLAQDVWQPIKDTYTLRADLKTKILNYINKLPDHITNKVWIIGSITGHYYNDTTDIDIHLLPKSLSDEEYEKWKDKLKSVEDSIGKHPIQFYIHEVDVEPYADAIYDVKKDEWIKQKDVEHANIADYYEQFKSVVEPLDLKKAELYRDLIDYKELSSALKSADNEVIDQIENELQETLDEINLNIDRLINAWEIAKDRRTQALYSKFEHGIEDNYENTVKTYSSQQLLPDNVIYKLLERYHYKKFIVALRKYKKENGEIDSEEDVDATINNINQ